ncbi:MAG: hypothetical protein ACYDIA_07105 [Candidatus Humimicrobiaceae bacterium]
MELNENFTKLIALKKLLDSWIENPRVSILDPRNTLDIFERYERIRNNIKTQYPNFFDDLPVRQIPKSSGTTDFNGRGYIEIDHFELLLKDINYCLDILSNTPAVNIPSMTVSKEGIFFAGQYFDAFLKVSEILKSANKSIFIIDNYINDEVLNSLTIKKQDVIINILTNSRSIIPQLKSAVASFNKQYKNLEIRISDVFHDRFILIDYNDLYHFGASIKDAGNRGFMFSRIEEVEIINLLKKKFNEEWNKAANI